MNEFEEYQKALENKKKQEPKLEVIKDEGVDKDWKLMLETDIEREKGYLYFTKGNPVRVYRAKIGLGGRKKGGKKRRREVETNVEI